MKKGYLIGAVAAPLLGLLLWKLLLPQVTGLDGVFIFMLGFFCLWTAAACPLGLLSPGSSPGYRWAYGGVFFALFLVQLAQGLFRLPAYTLINIFLLSALYLIQQLEHKSQDK